METNIHKRNLSDIQQLGKVYTEECHIISVNVYKKHVSNYRSRLEAVEES